MEQKTNKIKYFLYARKSSEAEDKQILSLDSQTSEMKQLAKRNNHEIVETKTEAHSAKAPGRPVFNKMLDDIEANKIQGIIVWNSDRLSRNSVDTGRLIYLFDLGKLVEVVTPGQVFRNTPNDKFLFSLLCGQAKLENDNKGINVKRGLKTKAERGCYPTHAQVGYLNNRLRLKGEKDIMKDPERFPLIRKMFDLMLGNNYTPPKILEIATKEWGLRMTNGKPMARSTIYRIFTDTFYYGLFEYPKKSGNWYRGTHEPIITAEEFDRIQILLGRKGKPRPKTHLFAFTGMIRCGECGCLITAEEKIKRQKNGNIHRYIYYHCTKRKNPNCTQGTIEVKDLETQIIKVLDSLKIPPEFHNWAMKWFRVENEKEAVNRNSVLNSQQKNYEACVKKIDALIDMRAAGELTEAEFSDKKGVVSKEKAQLQELLTDTDNRVDKWLNKAEEIFAFARDACKNFKVGDMETKKSILSFLGQNLLLKDKILSIDVENSLIPIIKCAEEVKAIHKGLEPLENRTTTEEIERLYAKSPTMLPG